MPTLPELDITFYDHLLPAITAGTYRVDVRHVLKDAAGDIDGPDNSPDKLPTTSEEFEIRAVQFVLDPSSVHAVFPAPGASGDYTLVLPHITLNRSILPWEREPKWSRVEARAPWLALMVFREGELPEDPDAMGLAASRTVEKLCRPADTETGVLGPAIRGLPRETEASTCRTIDVPVALFRRLIPTEDELYYLAHVRRVEQAKRRFEGEVLTEGDYAVVTANRFPCTGGAYTVHLVSLEGHDKPLAGIIPGDKTHLRLCTLWTWSFTSDENARFDAAGLLRNLVAPASADPERLTLRLEPQPASGSDPEDIYVKERLKLGYVPVPHRVLSGELGYAWYRGPCTPVTAQELPPTPGDHTTADHLLIYEEDHGLFDVSYASAWTLGRAIGLADPDYAADVTRARRELANQAAAMMALAADPARCARVAQAGDPVPRRGLDWLRTLAETPLAETLAAPPVDPLDVPRRTPRIALTRAEARATLSTKAAQSALRATAEARTASIPTWLDRLGLLRGVPFHYLVPHPDMLPDESLRVFAIDEKWIDALVEGAASVGIHTSMDQRLNTTLRAATTAQSSGARPKAGLLLRSQLVPAWPDIILTARRGKDDLGELRRAHLAPDTLLVLFADVPDSLTIREPGQGIHFGIDKDGVIGLRQLTPNTTPALGASLPDRTFPDDGTSVFDRFLRQGSEDVLNLLGSGALVPELARTLGKQTLRPSELAVQLVNAPLEQLLLPRP